MKKLKIGIVVDQMLAGGVQLAAIEQVRQLNKLGHRATLIILMRKKYPIDFSYLVNGVPHEYLSDSYPTFFKKTVKFPVFSFFSTLHVASPLLAPKVLAKKDFNILISWGTTTSLTTQAIYKRLKIPYFAIIHDPIIYILDKVYSKTLLSIFFPLLKPIARYFEGSFVRDAKKTILISKVHQEYIKKTYGVATSILPLGVAPPKSVPKKRGKYLLSFGRWQREKNPQFLLTLLAKIPGTKLILAGSWIDNEELAWFKRKVKKRGFTSRVEIIPHYSNNELKKLTRRARLFLHPHFEAFGLAALEAASHGLPIIIPEKSGVTEGFEHAKHGFFPKKVNYSEYYKYIKKLISDERLAYKMGKDAHKVVKKDFSWEVNAKKLLELIQKTLAYKQKPNILVIETGHAQGISLSGGDKLMEPMSIRLAGKYEFTVVVSEIGADHWRRAPLRKKILTLPINRFDKTGNPVDVFLTYVIRMIKTTKIAKGLGGINYVYSSTNILPDVIPAYITRGGKKDLVWIARIHHLIPPPTKREGRFVVNFVSYIMQTISLFMIKSRADVIIALNKKLKNELADKGFPKHRLKVLGAGINFEETKILKPKADTKSYQGIYLGRIHPTKGVFDLVPIWELVIKKVPNAKLAVIGVGEKSTENNLQNLLKRKRLNDCVDILGFVPNNELYSLMRKARVFLFTDHEAGWGIAVAEAMACKLPVVGYDIGILGNVFGKGYKKVKPGDHSGFAQIVADLLTNERSRKLLSQKAFTEAKKHNWSNTSEKFEKILQEGRRKD